MREARPRRLLFFRWLRDATVERPKPTIEAVLEPVEPEAWSAWARERERELAVAAPNQAPATTPEACPGPVTANRLDMSAVACPRDNELRLRP